VTRFITASYLAAYKCDTLTIELSNALNL